MVGSAFRVNGSALLAPCEVETVTLYFPGAAVASMEKLAVMDVVLATLMFETVIPVPPIATFVPPDFVSKLLPTKVTVAVVPGMPLDGVIDVSVGAGVGGVTANGNALLV